MRRFVTSAGGPLLALWLLFAVGLSAHPLSQVLADPPARARALEIQKALREADLQVDDPAFQQLVAQDPLLSRRAFVALLDIVLEQHANDPKAAEATAEVVAHLAQVLQQQYGDPRPVKMLQAMIQGEEQAATLLLEYVASVRSEGSQSQYGRDARRASEFPEEGMAILRPFLRKLMRIQYATALSSPELIIAELDTYPEVAQAFEQTLLEAGADPATADLDPSGETSHLIALRKLTIMAELGLLEEFEKGSRELLAAQKDHNVAAAVLLSGFRAADRQRNTEQAAAYLQQARQRMASPEAASDPVLEYALRTAEFQVRRSRGLEVGPDQLLAEAEAAWKALEAYQPLMVVRHEANWYYGRMATRYWMDQLRDHPQQAGQFTVMVLAQLMSWVGQADGSPAVANLENIDDTLLQPDEAFGVFALMVAMIDQLTYSMESVPIILEQPGIAEAIGELDGMTQTLIELQDDLLLTEQGPGFPSYDVREGGMVPELQARSQFLLAQCPTTPTERKLEHLDRGLTLVRKTRQPEVTVDYLIKAGRQFSGLGRSEQAIGLWREALALADELSFVRRSLDASALLAKEYGKLGRWEEAARYAERASDSIVVTAPMLGWRSEQGQALAQTSQELTAISMQAAVENDNPEKALAAVTRSQQVQAASVQMESKKEAQAEAREVMAKEGQVVALAQEVKRLEAMPASPTRNTLLESTQGLLASTRAEFLSQSRELRKKYSDLYARVLRFDPLNLPEIQKSLPSDLAVVQYFPTQDSLYIFLVTGKDFRLRQVPISQSVLETTVMAYLRAIRRPGQADAALASEGTKLYQWLVAPVKSDIAASKTLVLIPSGRLNSLPFACLSDASGVPLVEQHEILELAKSTDLIRMSGEAPKPVKSLVAFADATGDLPAAAREGEQIAKLFGQDQAKLFKGKEATRDAFQRFGAQADALHLATHGEWNIEDSLSNYLAMANQQKVSQDEIFELGLDNTSIVILSACNTAMGEGGDVKYVASLAEAFWIAGSRSVVASLWAVNDESTSMLMTEFYKSLRGGQSKSQALRSAQLAVRSQDGFHHPYYWAGFILFGDWR